MSDREEYDSDAPEELTAEQGVQQDEELRKIQIDNKARIVREGKERRRQWAQKKTPRPSRADGVVHDVIQEPETEQEFFGGGGMLPDHIVKQLADCEKKVFLSDSEEEKDDEKPTPRRKRAKNSNSGLKPVILKDIPPPQCIESSLEFLKKKKMQVARSSSVLNNSNQALRFLSTSGLLGKN